MISNVLTILQRGVGVMRSNSRILLVGILVFIFPLLFAFVTQSFFTTAYSNIVTADTNRLSVIHSSLASFVNQNTTTLPNHIAHIADINSDITAVRVLRETDDGFQIEYALDDELVGTVAPEHLLLTDAGFTDSRTFIRTEFLLDGHRVWHAFSRVQTDTGYRYIFTEQNFKRIDSIMASRKQQSYFGLTAIFLFLIGLAYWLHRQTHWQALHKRLEQQLHERDLFSNMIAHEFRTPLTAIKGYASFLEEEKSLSKEEQQYVVNIRLSADRLVTLVNDFLEVARLQSGKIRINYETVSISDVIGRVVEDLQPIAQEKNLELAQETPRQNITLTSDAARITQILHNIVTNAIKYSPEGSVTIAAQQHKSGEVTIRIKDTGTGISAEDQAKLFAPFMRVGGVDSTATTGTGLGMWITKQLVSVLHGSIGVESIKGIGTHVVITLHDFTE